MMDYTQEFVRAWHNRYPHLHPPTNRKLAACLAGPPSAASSAASSPAASPKAAVSDEERARAMEELLLEVQDEAERLEAKAAQRRFVVDFLDRLLRLSGRGEVSRPSQGPGPPGSSSASSASTADSPLSPAVAFPSLPRATRFSMLSPMVPRGTLTKVKDALRQSGMLFDSSEEEEEEENVYEEGEALGSVEEGQAAAKGSPENNNEAAGEKGDGSAGLQRSGRWPKSNAPRRQAHYAKALGGRIRDDMPQRRQDQQQQQAAGQAEKEADGQQVKRRSALQPLPDPPPLPPEEDGDCDSLDDYLYDSLSDGDDPRVPGKETAPPVVASKPFFSPTPSASEPPPASANSRSSRPQAPPPAQEEGGDLYVSLDVIKRKKQDGLNNAGGGGNGGGGSGGQPKTLHERLSYAEMWKGPNMDLYEELGNMTTASPTQVQARPWAGGGGADADVSAANRRGVDMSLLGQSETMDREEDPYEVANDESAFLDEENIDVTGLDRSNDAVSRRLARAYQHFPIGAQTIQQHHHQQQQIGQQPYQRAVNAPAPWELMLREAQGDTRRQELIHILKNEEVHLQILEIMNGCQRLFLAHNFPEQKISVVFNRVAQLRDIQESFVMALAKRLNDWKSNSTIADVFAQLDDYQALKSYINNMPIALKTFEEVIVERREFAERINVVVVQGKTIMFRDLMQQPVVWLTKSIENLKRIIQHTPPEHPDHEPLENLLSQLLIIVKSGTFGGQQKDRTTSMIGNLAESGQRSLVRHSLVVELSANGSVRKLRHVFLFSDMLVCAKPRPPNPVGSSFEVRWVIPVSQAVIYKVTDTQTEEMKSKRKAEIETLKQRIKQLRKEIKKEMDKDGVRSSFRRWNWAPGRRGADKLKEQLHKTQAQLVLASPNLEFKISANNEKKHTLLMSSEFERRSWTDSLVSLKAGIEKSPHVSSPSTSDVQVLLEDYKDMVSVNRLGSCLLNDGHEGVISGVLSVKIHKVEGLQEPISCIVCVEVDSFEHFDLCAKTSPKEPSCDPEINEEFDIELDFSTTVRFIVCQEVTESDGPTAYQNIAMLELRLDIDSLSHYVETPHGLATFQDPSHSILLTLSLSYKATLQTLARQPSERRGGIFGVSLDKVVRREMMHAQRSLHGQAPPQVPLIVRACADELDKRALEEPGIYRISGMSADVAKLKDSFDRNVTATARLLANYDVHVISGVLKAYLRELPEPLFTVERYRDFMDAFEMTPPMKRENFIKLLNGLPQPNVSTARHLLRHFARINKKSDVNKMVSGNLGLIFGPTLLSPASAILSCDILSVTMESFKQSGALTFMITLTTEGHVFGDDD